MGNHVPAGAINLLNRRDGISEHARHVLTVAVDDQGVGPEIRNTGQLVPVDVQFNADLTCI